MTKTQKLQVVAEKKAGEMIIDLSKFSTGKESLAQLLPLISKNRTFWGQYPLVIRLADGLDISEQEVETLREIIAKHNLNIQSLQMRNPSATLKKILEDSRFKVTDLPKISKISKLFEKDSENLKQNNQEKHGSSKLNEIQTSYIFSEDNIALRSGQEISCEGNLIIFGDTNPGCKIYATGSIIVYGKLCGSVHAGFKVTDKEQIQKIFIKALKIGEPSLQVNIGDYSACSTAEDKRHKSSKLHPETIKVMNGQICRLTDF